MNRNYALAVSVFAVLLWWPADASSQGLPNTVLRGEPQPTDVREQGTLICFRCDITPNPHSRARCQQEGHQPLLSRVGGHPYKLIGSTNSITAKLSADELHGKQVRIKGIYYPKTNQVLVEEVSSTGQ